MSAPVAMPEPNTTSATHRSACATMPTATGQASMVGGIEKKMQKQVTATPATTMPASSGLRMPQPGAKFEFRR